jgi:microcystin-dependent protein
MASTFTTNTGIEKPGSGEQAGAWGATINSDFDIIDTALNGQVDIAIVGSTDLTTTNGSPGAAGINPVLILTGTPGSTFQLQVTPTDQEKMFHIRNETDAACRVIYKGVTYSASNGVEIPAGDQASVTGDGGGAVSGVFKTLEPNFTVSKDTAPTLGGDLDVDGNAIVSSSNGNILLSPDGTGVVQISGNSTQAGTLRITEDTDDGSNYIDIKAPALSADIALTLPDGVGGAGEALISDGSGNLSFSSVSSPSGIIVAWSTGTAPSGWLECDGSAVDRTTYAALFSVISDDYGAGDGSTTFNLPDLRGEFIRGYDNGATNDPDAASRTDRGDGTTGDAVGTKQLWAVEDHEHRPSLTGGYNSNSANTAGFSKSGTGYSSTQATSGPITTSVGGYTGVEVSTETRSRNVSMMWIIKT